MSRADRYPGFPKAYGLHFEATREMDLSLTYRALAEIRSISLPATPPMDDRNYFPPYDAVPVVRQATLEIYPALRDVLKQLGAILAVDEMRKLNYAVDGEKRQAKDVAREFLRDKGLVP